MSCSVPSVALRLAVQYFLASVDLNGVYYNSQCRQVVIYRTPLHHWWVFSQERGEGAGRLTVAHLARGVAVVPVGDALALRVAGLAARRAALREPEDRLARVAGLGAVLAADPEPLEDAGRVLAVAPVVAGDGRVDGCSAGRRHVSVRGVCGAVRCVACVCACTCVCRAGSVRWRVCGVWEAAECGRRPDVGRPAGLQPYE